MALGATMLNNAANSGDAKALAHLLADYQSMSRAGAQATQANRLLKKMSPEGQLYAVERTVSNLQQKLNEEHRDKAPTLEIDPALIQQFLDADDQKGREKAMGGITKSVAEQVPSTWVDKWNAWRYMAMLTNPRTHIRNMVGNVGFQPIRMVKNGVGAAIESGLNAAGVKVERTKSFSASPAMYKAAWGDFENVSSLMNGTKYNDAQTEIERQKPVFKGKFLEGARRGNSWLLEAEDAIFKRITYADSLAGYLRANGVKASDFNSIDAGIMDKARAHAIKEAMKATYQDQNAFSDFISSVGRGKAKNSVVGAAQALAEGVLPFRRTPANILVRGVAYSPIGLPTRKNPFMENSF